MWIKDIRDYILYEDREILVCHKPAGIAVQNARVGSMDMESLLKNYIAQKNPGKMPYLGIIHRLDQPVEGVLVFALNGKAAAELNRQMTSGGIEKIYLAVTAGHITQEKAVLEDWLKKDNRTNSSAVVPAGTAGAKKAVLSYEVIEQKETGNKTGGEAVREGQEAEPTEIRSLLRIHLDTGRHHQIRVQMAHALNFIHIIVQNRPAHHSGQNGYFALLSVTESGNCFSSVSIINSSLRMLSERFQLLLQVSFHRSS